MKAVYNIVNNPVHNIVNKGTTSFFIVLIISMLGTFRANAQEFHVQGDLVSSYVWRGMYQTGASIQPTLGFGIKGFSLTAWGSTDFDGYGASEGLASKEIDLTAAYTFGQTGLTLSVADLWWAGQGACSYFNFRSHETAHHFEAGLAYTLPVEQFPLSIAWYTMFAGMDKKINSKGEAEQNYSSYVEFNYPFRVKTVDLNLTCGVVPYKAPQYYCNGFAVTNVALKGTTSIRLSERFALPIFAQAIWNPRLEDAHLVFGITLKP